MTFLKLTIMMFTRKSGCLFFEIIFSVHYSYQSKTVDGADQTRKVVLDGKGWRKGRKDVFPFFVS